MHLLQWLDNFLKYSKDISIIAKLFKESFVIFNMNKM